MKEKNDLKKEKRKKGKLKKILLIILLIIVVPIIVFFGYRFISTKISKSNSEKFNNNLNELAKERIDYVFIEINPSLVLTVKDNKVEDISCLNDDCMTMYNELNVKGKNINDSIDTIYNKSKEKGFDVSNGVKIKTSNNVNIEVKDHIIIEHIDSIKEQELLKEVKNNEDIKNVSNDDYYTSLWEELKKDKDYDNFYTCKMVDKELKCYFAEKFLTMSNENNGNGLNPRDLSRVLDKFGIKYESWNWGVDFGDNPYGLYINGKLYYMVNDSLEYYGDIPDCESEKSGMPTGYVSCAMSYGNPENIIQYPKSKLNLLTSQFDS